jgi:NAD(P)-dependent dehydrogenase (short-subunit alcohol dehydrogenase family)
MTHAFQRELLRGKVAYVAGGSSGINLQIAQCLAAHGAAVALVSRTAEKVQSAAATIRDSGATAIGIAADVRDYDAIAASMGQTAAELGTPDIVVSGAAGNFVAPAHRLSTNGFKTIVDIDLVGTFNVFRSAFDVVNGKKASFIAISAPQSTHPYRFQAHVCAAKAGVDMLVKCLALEWGPHGIRVNAIVPGPIADTVGMEKLTPTPEARRAREQTLPLQRYGVKQEIADLAVFLGSDASQYMTGAIVPCDGGMSLVGDAK